MFDSSFATHYMIFPSMTHVKCVAYFLILAVDNDDDDDNNTNDDELTSSDESLSIEFPPPPPAFCTPSTADTNCQFVPVKHSFIQTTVGRSDSGM